jgi:tetratricopeptide (TPR) repeat protein
MRRLIGLCLAAVMVAAAGDKLDDARAELRAGHANAAIELLRDQVAKDPAAVESSVLLSETLLSEERFDEAGEVIDGAIVKHQSEASLQRVLGDLRYREGRIFDAEKAYKAAIKLDPHNARAIYGISRVFQVTCLRRKASEMLQVAHAIDFHDPHIAGAFYFADRRSQAAIARMEAALARQRGTADGKADPALEHVLEMWIAEAKALDGKPEFDLSAPGQQYRIPLRRLMDGRRITGASLPVQINGVKADLRLDTGAGGILLSSRFAERAGIRRLADTEIFGIGNGPAVKGWVGYAPKVQIGNLEFANCIVSVPEKGSTDDSGGLIGSDIFQRFLVKINFAVQSLDLDPLPGPAWDGHALVDRYDGPELAGYSQMLIIQHNLLIPTVISESTNAEQTAGLFLLDSGARLNMISTNLAPAITNVHDSQDRVRGISGKVKMVYQADKIVLQFANFRQLNLDLASFDLTGFSRGAETEISGIMGLPPS